ncbi:MAG: DUF4118 domain-containing protein [Polyangiaceae bacterium]
MSDPPGRPDPDALLTRVKREEARAKRGKLKVFFGFAPGVGKTYRMLQVARDMVVDQRLDVLVGVVETHKRYDTASLLLGMPLLPMKKVEHRGRALDEFDLDLALARHPRVILVDELAHTNAPGSRHAKRWQDVEELIEAGIDVFTTMNVQHVESLNDVVAQITGVRVRETVPDAVIDRADAVELVDVAPEELLQRLDEGKVYLPDQAKRAAAHFFKRGNLLALRELALRRTAQHVDEDVQEYREEHGVASTWPAGERVLVAIGPAPSSARLLRAAARTAAGLRCPWIAAYVEPIAGGALNRADRERLDAHLRLAESLGAAVTRLTGPSVAEAILAHARKENVTRILLGKPTHPRLWDRLRGSLLDEVVRGSGEIDVHVISGDSVVAAPVAASRRRPSRAPIAHYFSGALIVAATLAVASGLHATLDLPDLEMLFLVAVMTTAMRFGRGPALLAAALSVACYDFFFVPPIHTFSVADRRYFLTFAMMFGVGFVMSRLASRMRRAERAALAREERASVLYALTRELSAADAVAPIGAIAARHAAEIFRGRAVILSTTAAGDLAPLSASPADATVEPKDRSVAAWTHEHDELAGLGTDTLPGSAWLCAPLRTVSARAGVLCVRPEDGAPLSADQRAFLDVYCRQVALAMERARLSSRRDAP